MDECCSDYLTLCDLCVSVVDVTEGEHHVSDLHSVLKVGKILIVHSY